NLNRPAEALTSYDRAIAADDNAESRIGRGMLRLSLQRDIEALPDFDRALSFSRGIADGWLGRGTALFRLGRFGEAEAAFDECLRLRPQDKNALYNRANARLALKHFDDAARDAETLLQLDPEYAYAPGLLLHARLYACDWRDYQRLCSSAADAVKDGRRAIHPFLNLAMSDVPALNLRAAEVFARDLYPPPSSSCWRGELYRHDRIRVAYLSADFYDHATAFLMAGVFEQHDRRRFETISMSYGPDDRSRTRHRLQSAFDHFLDVRTLSDRTIAEELRAMEVDIAIDLKGYTGEARPGILAQRAAPIQVHYLGYPGSLGTSTIDYLIADKIVIPQHAMKHYAEQVVYLPGCYQCNDSKRPDFAVNPNRAELGLPENAFVFCCFNSSFKIGPDIFAVWMRLLREIPDSVLWLLKSSPGAAANLGREAVRHGIAAERLIFAELVPLQEHLARLRVADLALDTFPYGAHTTASDAVWAGVPLLTIAGASFASRVAASILTSAGLSGFVTASADEYLDRAISLARSRETPAAIRKDLRERRGAMSLFDTALFTRRLESAYTMMYERYQSGLPPACFTVSG
ncbi:MAG: tetratricopeptide repeat protein, partial [Alphaproteobacteria bacterium]|nr:tetratricopeptide repeat protein [Alphaproteobacteria bacterium]